MCLTPYGFYPSFLSSFCWVMSPVFALRKSLIILFIKSVKLIFLSDAISFIFVNFHCGSFTFNSEFRTLPSGSFSPSPRLDCLPLIPTLRNQFLYLDCPIICIESIALDFKDAIGIPQRNQFLRVKDFS